MLSLEVFIAGSIVVANEVEAALQFCIQLVEKYW